MDSSSKVERQEPREFMPLETQLTPRTPGLEQKQVLVVGFRKPIIDVLERLRIPFAVWHDRPIKRELNCLKSFTGVFPSKSAEVRETAGQQFSDLGPFSDVIAGTEASVYAASVCRRLLGARKSKDSIALRCSDKRKMKMLMSQHDVPMTDFLTRFDASSYEEIFDRLGPKIVVKQRKNSGGRGLSIAHSVADLAARKEHGLLYERFIDAHELSIESFVNQRQIQFSSTTNYLVKTHANIVPANLPPKILEQVQAINVAVIAALKLEWGLTHAEFYWNDKQVLFGEIALRPPGGYIMECIGLAYNFDAWEAFVANELGLLYSYPSDCRRTAGVAMVHAGEGIVESIHNQQKARDLPSCIRLKVLVRPGDRVSARTGVSEVSAYGMFVSNSAEKTTADVEKCLEWIRFTMKE